MANEIYEDFCRRPWKTEPETPAGNCGYCGPDVESETTEEGNDNE